MCVVVILARVYMVSPTTHVGSEDLGLGWTSLIALPYGLKKKILVMLVCIQVYAPMLKHIFPLFSVQIRLQLLSLCLLVLG
jgi:hypothetical protein